MCLRLRKYLGTVFDDELFAPLFPSRGQPAAAPWRLAVVTVLQFAEGLSDRHAADAVRTRIDWKYLLGLELSDPGFDYSILSRFRERLVKGNAEMWLLETLLERCRRLKLVRELVDMRTDSTHAKNKESEAAACLSQRFSSACIVVAQTLRERPA
jgi:transposase